MLVMSVHYTFLQETNIIFLCLNYLDCMICSDHGIFSIEMCSHFFLFCLMNSICLNLLNIILGLLLLFLLILKIVINLILKDRNRFYKNKK